MGAHKRQLLLLLFTVTLWPLICHAEPALDFIPDNGATFSTSVCADGGSRCNIVGGQTRFATVVDDLLEVVNIDGVSYIHQIMGDPASGFAQEVYIKQTGMLTIWNNPFDPFLKTLDMPLGAYLGAMGSVSNQNWTGGNGEDPLNVDLGLVTGSGSANPNRVIIRQFLNDGEMIMEFLKDQLDRKPVITMLLNTPNISSTVVIDMRNSTYDDMNIQGVMINTMSLSGAGSVDANFNMATDSQNSTITAGRYTWTSGGGPDGAGGAYTYLNGDVVTSAEMQAIDWSSYWDPFEENPWTQLVVDPARVAPNRPQ